MLDNVFQFFKHSLPHATFVVAILLGVTALVQSRFSRKSVRAPFFNGINAPLKKPIPSSYEGGKAMKVDESADHEMGASDDRRRITDAFEAVKKTKDSAPANIEGTKAELIRRREALQTKIRRDQRIAEIRLGMQVATSLCVLGGALYIIISPTYDPKDKHWAYGSAGTILGFWLKH
jgi:hypothetical protein